MLTAAVFCPHPPLLVPELASGAADELDDLRQACDDALRLLLASRPELVICVGLASPSGEWDSHAVGSLRPYGVDVRAGDSRREPPDGRDTAADPELPLALTLGAWLLDRASWLGERRYIGVGKELAPAECGRLGAGLVEGAGRMALLVMGDGSARRTSTAPGVFDDRAAGYDEAVADALSAADGAALLRLVPREAETLLVAGRAPWQVAAGALRAVAVGNGCGYLDGTPAGSAVRPSLHYAKAPYGVGYLVATWLCGDPAVEGDGGVA